MFKYFKNALLSLLILTLPYMNLASKAMEDEDYNSTRRSTLSVNEAKEDYNVASPSTAFQGITSDKELEEGITFTSLLISDIKSSADYVMQSAYKLSIMAQENPLVTGVLITSYLMNAVAAEYECTIKCHNGTYYKAPNIYYGCNGNQCAALCIVNNPQVQMLCGSNKVAGSGCIAVAGQCQ